MLWYRSLVALLITREYYVTLRVTLLVSLYDRSAMMLPLMSMVSRYQLRSPTVGPRVVLRSLRSIMMVAIGVHDDVVERRSVSSCLLTSYPLV